MTLQAPPTLGCVESLKRRMSMPRQIGTMIEKNNEMMMLAIGSCSAASVTPSAVRTYRK